MIKAAIFDMDGVVVDNHSYHFSAWMAFAKKYQFELNTQIYRDNFNGKTNADLFKMIFGTLSSSQVEVYANEKESLYQEMYFNHICPHTGLISFLKELKELNIKIALGTSAPPMNVDFTLDRLNLRHYFDVIVDGSQVQKGKPDPEVYLLCAERLNVQPERSVVFEDSLAGLESGRRAGCKIVAVATSHKSEELFSKTNLVISDFTQGRKILGL